MLIELDKSATILRLTTVSGNKTAYSTVTIQECTRQPLGDEKTAQYGGSYGKMFIMYFDVTANVNEGDKIRIGDDYYQVVSGGVNKRDDGIIADYLSVTVTKSDD